jgi:hypothetical protein
MILAPPFLAAVAVTMVVDVGPPRQFVFKKATLKVWYHSE